jgi:protease IV
MRESIFHVALRSFFSALFTMAGIGFGLIPVLIIIAALSGASDSEPESKFSLKIAPNAEGIRKNMSKDSPVILKINIVGVIGGEEVSMKNIRQLLVESRENVLKNNRVKGILLNIESPGGTVVDADGIYHALKNYKEQYKVPVYAYVDGLCASGGIYVACAADKIYASDASIVGSVGVIAPSFVNLSTLLDKIGVTSLTLFAGKGKDDLNPLRPWVPGEQAPLQTIINDYYKQFVEIVATNRPIDRKKLVDEYGANVYPAKQAANYGYIDGSGLSYSDALKKLLKKLSIEDDYYQVIEMESKTWYSTLFNSQSTLFTGKIKHQIQLTPELDADLLNKYLYLYQPGLSH